MRWCGWRSGRRRSDGWLDDVGRKGYIVNMADLSVSLPAELQSYVESRVVAEGFADPADFLRTLVQRDQESYHADVRRVQALIQEGIDSGSLDAEPEDILDEIIAGIHEKHG
jgi:antitoxin ParD1/3/4